ncbi:hypothetical protein [Pectinatus frisingensis]|uniref:hypothetical protein n=1 Tax=Pectinatus frisingensis TaxID=865 RepID=UPI0018C5EE1E|nr:hypothetical protein [Pectinatus frisingensis]
MKKILITIDTEGDNMWRPMYSKNAVQNRITIVNGDYLLRFQKLCEKYSFIPTYFVDYEMSFSKRFTAMAKKKLLRGTCEIGMHMHGWSVPPYYPLKRGAGHTGACNPYISEYPNDIIENKVQILTEQLQKIFECSITSHRSGRWLINKQYLKILRKYGYLADCSVTPGVDWRNNLGLTEGIKGPDYRGFPKNAYELNEYNICKCGRSGILEIPVTVRQEWINGRIVSNWLRPNGNNLNIMLQIVERHEQSPSDYLEFMIHSSELMPFGSPGFRSEGSIEKIYCDMDQLFSKIAIKYEGMSITTYARNKLRGNVL